MVITSLGLESLTCFWISATVYSGLAVVAMAPMAITPKKHRGYWMELGAKIKTTSFFFRPSRVKPWETLMTMDLNWEKFTVSPEWASMRAGLLG